MVALSGCVEGVRAPLGLMSQCFICISDILWFVCSQKHCNTNQLTFLSANLFLLIASGASTQGIKPFIVLLIYAV